MKKVADYIHSQRFHHLPLSVRTLTDLTGCSRPALSRFLQAFDGIKPENRGSKTTPEAAARARQGNPTWFTNYRAR